MNLPSPYVIPRFNELSKLVDLKVVFFNTILSNRNWDILLNEALFEYEILEGKTIEIKDKDRNYISVSTKTVSVIKKEKRLDAVINFGWDSVSTYLNFLYCKWKRIPFFIFSESTFWEKSWRRTITLPVVKFLVRNCYGAIACGERSKEYFIRLGVKPKNIFIAPDSVDNELFSKELTNVQKVKIKKKWNIPTKNKVILYVGQFIERKGVKHLLHSFNKLKKEYPNTSLLLVGEGYQITELKEIIKKLSLKDVIFAGRISVKEMPSIYSISDMFILPSYEEVWGMVVNEAMCAKLPIITTEKVGCGPDLVKNGKNGYIIKENNSNSLYGAMQNILKNNKLNKMGLNSYELIKNYTPKKNAEGIFRAIKSIK